ncbi:alpha/beta hydrolase [Blastococcus sp. SYSU D00922]
MTAEPTAGHAPGRTEVTSVPAPRAPSQPAGATEGPPAARWSRWLPRYTWSGTLAALLFGCSSLTPSLLPRGWLLQGLIAGITAAIGYGVGVTVAWFVAEVTDRRLSAGVRRRAWQVLAIGAALLVVITLVLGAQWQRDIHELMGLDPPSGYSALGIVVVAVLVFAFFVAVGRGIRALARWLVRVLGRVLPRRLARPLGVVVVTALVLFLLNGVLFRGFVDAMNSAFSVKDDGTEAGAVEPVAAERSGSPASLVPWEDLGLQGRNFVGTGPTAADLTAFSGQPALEPVRAYVGLASGDDVADRAALAVRELERAGGFDRSALVVVTTTGTGWVDPAASDALEYELNGDSAMVAMQYSYLPSWMSFLVDQVKAQEAGRALFDAVYGTWAQLPPDARPQLYVFGESLGTFGGEAAFSGLADIVNRTDGVLWAGPPNFNQLTRSIVDDRDEGSPEWLPVYEEGRTVRFADEAPDLDRPGGRWGEPRVVYLQNASDPIVWWSPRLILSRPDWLEGERGPDVSQGMVWLPFVTFWQVTADMVFAVEVPDGHGHAYRADYVDGWAQVVRPPGWDDADTERLRALVGG